MKRTLDACFPRGRITTMIVMKSTLLTVSFLFLACALSRAEKTAAGATSPCDDASDPSVDSVRLAYTEGKDTETVLLADRALSEIPSTDGRTAITRELHFWRGAALRRLGRSHEALIALEAAGRHGLRTPELHLERALILRALGQEEDARRAYQEAERLLQEDPERLKWFEGRWRLEGKDAPRLQFWITPQLGYDSNVVGLDKDAPLANGDLERESTFTGGTLLARYFLIQNENQRLSIDYRNEARAYLDEPDLDYTDNYLSALGRYPVWRGVDLELRTSLGEAFSREEGHLRTLRIVAPSVLFNLADAVPVRLWADWTDADYYDDTVRDEYDRDGVYRRGGVAFGIGLGAGWSLGPAIYLTDFAAEGDDYDYTAWTASLSMTAAPYFGCVFSASVGYTWADYANENSLVGFTEKREDRILTLSLTITLRGLEGLLNYAPSLTIAYSDHGSNIDQYDYDRWEPRVEVGILALSF